MSAVAKSEANEPSVGALLGSLVNETGTLVRQEIHLASAEMSQKAKRAVVDVGVVGMGGALLHAGVLALIAALILGLGTLVPMWIAAAVIGVVVAGAGFGILKKGMTALKEIDPVPQRTMATLQQDKAFLKEQAR